MSIDGQCKVSVIIPIYNLEEKIQDCLHCFCQQTLKDIEIICVDDGSTDDTVKAVRRLQKQDTRIRLYQQHHQYAGAARNFGLSKAKGIYVYFFDGDDICSKELLEIVYQRAETVKADVVIFDFCQIDVDTGCSMEVRSVREVHKPYIHGKEVFCYRDIPYYISEMTTPAPWNKLYRKRYLDDARLRFSSLRSTNDLSFGRLSMICAKRIAYVNRSLMTYYYTRKGGAISGKKARWWKDVICAEYETYQMAQKLPQYEMIRPSLQLSCWANLRWFQHQYFPDISTPDAQEYQREINQVFAMLPLFDTMDPETIRLDAYEEIQKVKGKGQGDNFVKMMARAEVNPNGLLVYGIGAHLEDMLAWYPSLAGCIARVFDKNPEKVGKVWTHVACIVEPPEALKDLTEGTVVAISAVRYYDEIVRELHEMNAGLRFITIDDAWEKTVNSVGQNIENKV